MSEANLLELLFFYWLHCGIRYYIYTDSRHFSWNGATQLVLFRHGSILLTWIPLIFLLAIISRYRLFHFFSVAAAAHLAVFILSLLDNTGTGRNLEISWFYFLQLYSTLSTLHFKECFSHVIREKNTVRIATPDTHRLLVETDEMPLAHRSKISDRRSCNKNSAHLLLRSMLGGLF